MASTVFFRRFSLLSVLIAALSFIGGAIVRAARTLGEFMLSAFAPQTPRLAAEGWGGNLRSEPLDASLQNSLRHEANFRRYGAHRNI